MRALLLDLDGVLRIWDPGNAADAERLEDLPPGVLARAAFGDAELLHRAVTGAISDEAWRATVAAELQQRFDGRGARAVVAWSRSPGRVDAEVLELVRAARRRMPVGLLTNATSRLPDDLRALGLDGELDVVVSSADHGVAKPDRRIYEIADAALGCEAGDVLFVDDTAANVEGARAAGMDALLYTDVVALRARLGE